MNGLILFAHGARDPRWARPFEAVAERVRTRRADLQVRLAYLELMTPDLATAADELVAAGCRTLDVVPLFLGAGGHVRRDLPLLVDALAARHPAVQLRLHPAIGEQDAMIEAIAEISLALAARPA